jgi:hypothetical protein
MMEAVRTSETSVDNHFTRQYNPEDSSEHQIVKYRYYEMRLHIFINILKSLHTTSAVDLHVAEGRFSVEEPTLNKEKSLVSVITSRVLKAKGFQKRTTI